MQLKLEKKRGEQGEQVMSISYIDPNELSYGTLFGTAILILEQGDQVSPYVWIGGMWF